MPFGSVDSIGRYVRSGDRYKINDGVETKGTRSNVIFLSESEIQEGEKSKLSVYFNITTSLEITTRNKQSRTEQVMGELNKSLPPLPRSIRLVGWLSFNATHITKYLTDVILSQGIHTVQFKPLERKATLEKWKTKKTKLILYGIKEKNDNLVITSLIDKKTVGVDHSSNIHVSIGFNEVMTNQNQNETINTIIEKEGTAKIDEPADEASTASLAE